MPVTSEARVLANRKNSALSTGPRTPIGKQHSRANSFQHGLTGQGVVIPREDLSEVESRVQALLAQYDPGTSTGEMLVRRMAVLSMQMDRGAEHETAAIAMRVRHASEAFDDERFEEAEHLLDTIAESPRIHLRKLRKSPEGVDRMIEEWTSLRGDATREVRPTWTAWHLERAVNLTGKRIEAAPGSVFNALSKAIWGETDDREARALAQLVAKIDTEISALKAHRETLDLEMFKLDRAEAGSRALFDPSKEAALARRYESEAQRNFFKTLNELRQVEVEAAERPESEPSSISNSPTKPCIPLASFCESPPKAPRPAVPNALYPASVDVSGIASVARGADGELLRIGKVR